MVDHPTETTNLLLASMYRQRHPDRRRHQFIYSKPGASMFPGSGGTEVNYDHGALLSVALYLRKNGAPYLRSLSIDKVESMLTSFVSDQYYLIAADMFLSRSDSCYLEQISDESKNQLKEQLAASGFFVEPRVITLFPLVPIDVEASFKAAPFFTCSPPDLADCLGPIRISGLLVPDSFPPVSDWEYKRHSPTSWLGTHAPTLEAALQMRAAILGAFALLPHHNERYMFSGREQFGGYTSFSDGWKLSAGDPHTPPLMTNLVLGADDRDWLSALAEKIQSPKKADKKHLRALEYYYRAWAPDPVKRFPTLFASLDAIFGDASAATQAVIDAVGPVMGPEYSVERIRLLLGLRASVVHGGAPNVYESSKYEKYYVAYRTDATRDLELIVARCLQAVIFPGVMSEREHNHADLIKRETGRSV